jgi:hypothetical protein
MPRLAMKTRPRCGCVQRMQRQMQVQIVRTNLQMRKNGWVTAVAVTTLTMTPTWLSPKPRLCHCSVHGSPAAVASSNRTRCADRSADELNSQLPAAPPRFETRLLCCVGIGAGALLAADAANRLAPDRALAHEAFAQTSAGSIAGTHRVRTLPKQTLGVRLRPSPLRRRSARSAIESTSPLSASPSGRFRTRTRRAAHVREAETKVAH